MNMFNHNENYNIKKRKLIGNRCPPGYEKVKSYSRSDGSKVETHCRKIRVKGRTHAILSGTYNEAMIGQEDVRLGFDSLIDSTNKGENNAETIEHRAKKIETLMHEQEERKKEVRRREDSKPKMIEESDDKEDE